MYAEKSLAGDALKRYGGIPLDRIDVRERTVAVIDLRAETGAFGTPNANQIVPSPHAYTLSVFGVAPGEMPVGEVRMWWRGVEIALVGHVTGRGVVHELTPDHLLAAIQDETGVYADQLR